MAVRTKRWAERDGIYIRTRFGKSSNDPEGMKKLLKEFAQHHNSGYEQDYEEYLKVSESDALNILKSDGMLDHAWIIYKTKSRTAKDAKEILGRIKAIRIFLKNNEPACRVAIEADLLGRAVERARIRQFEKDIIKHQPLKKPKTKQNDVTDKEKASYQTKANEIWKNNLNHSKTNVAKIISKDSKRSYHTIMKHIKKPDPTG